MGGLLIALCALAALQYYWIDEVVRAERVRARSVLESAAKSLAESFDFEVTRAIATFALATDGDEPTAVRYEQWQRRAPYPRLLWGVYAVDHAAGGSVLQPLVPGEALPAGAAWRADVARLVLPEKVTNAPQMWDLTAGENPAFAFAFNGDAQTDNGHWGLAVFDRQYLVHTFLPELLRRYIPPGALQPGATRRQHFFPGT